jgi:uncharacterized membrane protein
MSARTAIHRRIRLWQAGCLLAAGVGLAVSVVLVVQSFTAGDALPGCGPGSPCESVLQSRWASWLGMPVALPAVALYVIAALAVAQLGPGVMAVRRRRARWVLSVAAFLALAAAVWFTLIQLFILETPCRYCLAAHGAGVVLAGLVIADETVRHRTGRSPGKREGQWRTAAVAGGVVVMILGQLMGPVPREREVEVLGYQGIDIRLDRYPRIGPAEAEHTVLVLADYTCPSCREMHRHLEAARERYGDQLALAIAPTPLDRACNPAIERTEPQHERACALADLALAVWQAEAEQFEAMDRWLFGSEGVRSVAAARERAAALVGADRLAGVLDQQGEARARFLAAQGRLNRDLGRATEAGGGPRVGQTLPKLVLSENRLIAGQPGSAEAVFADLEAALDLEPRESE